MRLSLGDRTPLSLLERLRQPASQESRQQDWQRFIDLYAPLVYATVRRRGLSKQDAEDVVQDVFMKLVGELPRFQYDPNKRFRGWLWTVVRNCLADRRRRRADAADGAGPLGAVETAGDDPLAEWAEAEYRRHVLDRALPLIRSHVEATTWRAFWEYAVEGRPADEVARDLGVSVETVYQARTRVVRRLRGELDGLLD